MIIVETRDYETIARLNEAVHKIHVELYPQHLQPYQYEGVRDFFAHIIKSPAHTFLLLMRKGEPIGYAWIEHKLYEENAFRKAAQSLYVHHLSINEEFRGQGYGTQVMNELYERARRLGVNKVELDYWSANEMTKHFYEKHGFQVYREFVHKYV